MSDQEIHIKVHTDSNGMVHLDLPTGIINQDIQLTVSYETAEKAIAQDNDLKEILDEIKPASSLSKYAGTLNLTEDPLTFQENIRSEW